jgi:hypothetical protein
VIGGELELVVLLDVRELVIVQAWPDSALAGPGQSLGGFLSQTLSISAVHSRTVAAGAQLEAAVLDRWPSMPRTGWVVVRRLVRSDFRPSCARRIRTARRSTLTARHTTTGQRLPDAALAPMRAGASANSWVIAEQFT